MQSQIIISICCITYNQKNYINSAIDGFLKQDFSEPYEIIIGDDGSTDGTRDIINEYARDYPGIVKVVHNDVNLGPNGNILSVLKFAKGQYISFCEGDDYWIDESKLTKQVDILNKHPAINFCFHRAYKETLGSRTEYFNYGDNVKIFSIKDVLSVVGQFAPTSSYMFRREFIQAIPSWFSQCSIGDLFLEIYSMNNGGIYIPQPMSVYRVNAIGSWSEEIKYDMNKFISRHLNIAKYIKLASEDFNDNKEVFTLKIANVYLNMCTRFVFEKDNASFRHYLERANEVNNKFTNKQRLYNLFKKTPCIIYYIHYIKSIIKRA